MKTLKKTLSLTLVFALVFSLMSMAFAAETTTTSTTTTGYKDAADITYKEAVDVTSAIGVFQGNDLGAFAPKDNLTREQAAKIICYLSMGQAAADKLSTSSAPFADVAADRWSAGSIAYCVQQGIVAGYGNGNFGPNDSVTGYQFEKMLLVALSYDPSIEGFTGNDWQINVAKRAFQNKLSEGNDAFVGTAAATREEAALYTKNTLLAGVVSYDNKGTEIKLPDGTTIRQGASAPEKTGNTFMKSYYPGLKSTDVPADTMGRTATQWINNGTKIGVYASGADMTFTAKAAGTTVVAQITAMGIKGYTFPAAGATYFKNGVAQANITSVNTIAGLTANGTVVELYLNADTATQIDKVVVIEEKLAQITSINTASGIVNLTSLDNTSFTVESDNANYAALSKMAVKDYVLINYVGKTVTSIATPKTVTGALTSIGTAQDATTGDKLVNATVTVGGTSYGVAAGQTDLDKLTSTTLSTTTQSTLYLDSYGFAIYIKDTAATSNYFLPVKATSTVVNGAVVTMLTGYAADGKLVTLNIGSQEYKKPIADNPTIYEYTAADSTTKKTYDAEYKIAAVASADATLSTLTKAGDSVFGLKLGDKDTGKTIAAGETSFKNGVVPTKPTDAITTAANYTANAKFIFINKDTGVITVKTGVQTVSASQSAYVLYTYDDTYKAPVVSAVYVLGDPTDATSSSVLYLAKQLGSSATANGMTYTYAAYIDGALTQITLSTKSDVGKFYTYGKDATSGVYTLATVDDGNAVTNAVKTGKTAASIDNGYILNVTGDTTYNAANAKIVDLSNNNIGSLTELDAAIKANSGLTVSFIYDNSNTSSTKGQVSYIYVLNVTKYTIAVPAAVTGTAEGLTFGAVTPNKTDASIGDTITLSCTATGKATNGNGSKIAITGVTGGTISVSGTGVSKDADVINIAKDATGVTFTYSYVVTAANKGNTVVFTASDNA